MMSGQILFLYAGAESRYRRALLIGGDHIMTCPTCGGALQAAGAKCTVCDPWAVPASDRTPGMAQLPLPAQYAMAPLPKWLTRIIKKNPPAPADLDQAFRRSVISWSFSGGYMLLLIALLLTIAAGGPVPVAAIAMLVATVAALVVSLRYRNRTWLARAVAVVGTRPDIGYHWFAGIPQLVRRIQILRSSRFTLILLIVGRIVLQSLQRDRIAPDLIRRLALFAGHPFQARHDRRPLGIQRIEQAGEQHLAVGRLVRRRTREKFLDGRPGFVERCAPCG